MNTAVKIALIIHIFAGTVALACGLLSMLNKKGSKIHRLTGKMFFVSMTGVFVTAIFISVVKNIPFLFIVGFFSYYLACSGYRALFLKKLHLQQQPTLVDWVINITGMLAGAGLIIFSYSWFLHKGIWGLVPLLFGLFCLLNGVADVRRFYKRPVRKQHWLFTHGSRMGGAFAATLTAFTVVNINIGYASWVLWILPGMLTGIWISKILRGYRKKFYSAKPALNV